MDGIFISYRRDDSAGYAGRLYDRLVAHFGPENVFMDVEGIEPGLDFVEAIEEAVSSCRVLIVIIGDEWTHGTDAAGRRRLDDPNDFIRLETGTALKRSIRVVPVLVGGAVMPLADELPEELKPLTRRQAIEINHKQWEASSGELIRTLEGILKLPLAGAAVASTELAGAEASTLVPAPVSPPPQVDPVPAPIASPSVAMSPVAQKAAGSLNRWALPAALIAVAAIGGGVWMGRGGEPERPRVDGPGTLVAAAPPPLSAGAPGTEASTPTQPAATATMASAAGTPTAAPAAAPVEVAQPMPSPEVSPPVPSPVPTPAPAPAPSPVIRTFSADASTARARLCYNVTHADSLTLSPRPGELGASLQDCVTVALDAPTTFTLTARNAGKTVRKTLKVAPLPVVAAAAAPMAAPPPVPAAAPAPAVVAAPAAPPAPVAVPSSPLPLRGERWVYRSSGKWGNSPKRTFEIVAQSVSNGVVTDALNILEPSGGGSELKRSRGNQPDFVTWGSIGFEFSPYFGAYLNLAQQGTLKGFPTPDLEPRFGQWYSEARMVGQETVTVPAGTFKAYKVEVWSSRNSTSLDILGAARGTLGRGDRMEPTRVQYLIWYAPEAKRYVRMERRVTSAANTESDKDLFELVSHQLP
jgi:hypothetical protein